VEARRRSRRDPTAAITTTVRQTVPAPPERRQAPRGGGGIDVPSSYSAVVLPTQLLWDPLPDPPQARRRGWFRWLSILGPGSPRMSVEDLVEYRVRRGATQALVRRAYQAAIAEQGSTHRPPPAFAEGWRAHLAALLAQPRADLPGWGPITIADLDSGFAWQLYEEASQARLRAIEQAGATPSRAVPRGQPVQTYEFAIASGGASLGKVAYGICSPCQTGLLYKIEFPPDWQFCGLGRLALAQLEARHPGVTWYTTGQYAHAQGFYDRYRQGSASPWSEQQHPRRISVSVER
jgi:hypothetical protein